MEVAEERFRRATITGSPTPSPLSAIKVCGSVSKDAFPAPWIAAMITASLSPALAILTTSAFVMAGGVGLVSAACAGVWAAPRAQLRIKRRGRKTRPGTLRTGMTFLSPIPHEARASRPRGVPPGLLFPRGHERLRQETGLTRSA